jgi:homoserine kinase
LKPRKNVAGVAALMLEALNSDAGFDIEIYKNIKAGSGMGAAASSAGAVYGINVY